MDIRKEYIDISFTKPSSRVKIIFFSHILIVFMSRTSVILLSKRILKREECSEVITNILQIKENIIICTN